MDRRARSLTPALLVPFLMALSIGSDATFAAPSSPPAGQPRKRKSANVIEVDYFAQAIRRDPMDDEGAAAPRFKNDWNGTCASSFIENNQGRYLLKTAKHCLQLRKEVSQDDLRRFGEICSAGKYQLTTSLGENAKCERIVAVDPESDIAILEFRFDQPPRGIRPLALGAFEPEIGSRLKITGYPADQKRDGKATVTENCWIGSGTTADHPGKTDPVVLGANAEWIRHNCSAHRGNSGGAVQLEGTNIDLGLISVSDMQDDGYRRKKQEDSQDYFLGLKSFIRTHRALLDSSGVRIVSKSPLPPRQASHLKDDYSHFTALPIGIPFVAERSPDDRCVITITSFNEKFGLLRLQRSENPLKPGDKTCEKTGALKCNPSPDLFCTGQTFDFAENYNLHFFGPDLLIWSRGEETVHDVLKYRPLKSNAVDAKDCAPQQSLKDSQPLAPLTRQLIDDAQAVGGEALRLP